MELFASYTCFNRLSIFPPCSQGGDPLPHGRGCNCPAPPPLGSVHSFDEDKEFSYSQSFVDKCGRLIRGSIPENKKEKKNITYIVVNFFFLNNYFIKYINQYFPLHHFDCLDDLLMADHLCF